MARAPLTPPRSLAAASGACCGAGAGGLVAANLRAEAAPFLAAGAALGAPLAWRRPDVPALAHPWLAALAAVAAARGHGGARARLLPARAAGGGGGGLAPRPRGRRPGAAASGAARVGPSRALRRLCRAVLLPVRGPLLGLRRGVQGPRPLLPDPLADRARPAAPEHRDGNARAGRSHGAAGLRGGAAAAAARRPGDAALRPGRRGRVRRLPAGLDGARACWRARAPGSRSPWRGCWPPTSTRA